METGDNSEKSSTSSSGYLVQRKSKEVSINRLEDFQKDSFKKYFIETILYMWYFNSSYNYDFEF